MMATSKTASDLQGIINSRGAADPISQQAQALLNALTKNPAAVDLPEYQEGLRRIGNAVSMAKGADSTNINALAKDASASIRSAVDVAGGVPATPEQAEAAKLKDADAVRKENSAKWDALANLPLTQLKSRFGLSDQEASEAHDKFVEAVNGYVDPAYEAALPDLVSAAAEAQADPEAVAAQHRALAKTEALTDLQESPEEKFMREQSRRTQERDLRSQRDADKNSLLARGAYGSGAEIAMSGQAQQEAAERRSLEELGANANAQKRALAAIGQMGELSGQMRDDSFGESLQRGSAADAVRTGNRSYKESYNRWKREGEVVDERGKVERGTLVKNSEDASRAEADKRSSALWGAESDVTAGSTGQYSKDSAPVASAFGTKGVLSYNREQEKKIEDEDGGFF